MKTRKFDFYFDGGHGWLKVSLKDLFKFCSVEQLSDISTFSYYRNNFVFLEEDCDCSIFLKALNDKQIQYSFNEHFSNKQSKIRNYSQFNIYHHLA